MIRSCIHIKQSLQKTCLINVIMSERLVLQDTKIWQQFLNKDLVPNNNMTELYFEEPDIEGFVKTLEESDFE